MESVASVSWKPAEADENIISQFRLVYQQKEGYTVDKNRPLTAAQIKALLTLIKIVKSMPEEEFIKRYASLPEDELVEQYLAEKRRQEGDGK